MERSIANDGGNSMQHREAAPVAAIHFELVSDAIHGEDFGA